MYIKLFEYKVAIENLFYFGASSNNPCKGGGSVFGFPKWYKYLDSQTTTVDGKTVCSPVLNGLNDIWLIVLAVVEILLRVAIIVAIVFVIVGGFKFITSRGESNPDKIGQARKTIIDALVGMIIAISATAVVSYIAGKF